MNKLLTFFAVCILAISMQTSATLIDFDLLDDGSYSTIGDTHFSLVGDGVAGNLVKNSWFGAGYLYNSSAAFLNPTNSILRIDFASSVQNLMFDFNSFSPDASLMSWRIFDDNVAEIAIGNIFNSISFSESKSYDLSAYSSINRIEFFNGFNTNTNNNNILIGLNKISFDVQTASVPEPSSLVIFLLALVGLTTRKLTLK